MKILIHQRTDRLVHSTDWSIPWIEYCQKNNLEYTVLDLFSSDIIKWFKESRVLLWHFSGYIYEDMLEARSILNIAKIMGLAVFPDFNENWHFDDKIAEMYALQSVGAPIPKSKVFYDIQSFKIWLNDYSDFPIITKLRTGSGSHNVKLFKNKATLKKYASRMLKGIGYNPSPSLLYKASSNIRSSHNKANFISKFKRIPEFINVLRNARKFPNEKGYVYIQEFIPNDGYDLKVVVVGDKLSGVVRPVRSHDFRASGGGEVFLDKEFSTRDIESAFRITDSLNMQCIGYDYVVNNKTKEAFIIEMSYGFSHKAILSANGYFDRNCIWHEEPLHVPNEILSNILINHL